MRLAGTVIWVAQKLPAGMFLFGRGMKLLVFGRYRPMTQNALVAALRTMDVGEGR